MAAKPLEPITIQLADRPAYPLQRLLTLKGQTPNAKDEATHESDLLKAIREALRGPNADVASPVTSLLYPQTELGPDEDELSWDTYNVVLGSGGVIRKKWSFEEEGQPVQWACMGWFEQPGSVSGTAHSGSYTSEDQDYQDSSLEDPNQRPTFGPFARVVHEAKPEQEPTVRARAVFVFLRSIGRVFFLNGLEHTFYLPFVVRRAWALSPHGIIMQRVLEPGELEEAEASGDEPLPTLFTMVNPFAEASTVGLTPSIKDGIPVVLDDKDSEKQIDSMPAHEHVLWVSTPSELPLEHIAVTLHTSAKMLSIWRYTYVHPKDVPQPIPARPARTSGRPRNSLSSPLSPRQMSFSGPIAQQPPLASLPGAPPALTTTTMAALVPGSVPNAPPAAPPKLPGWHEHPVNLDKATVGGRVDSTPYIDPVDHVRMKPSFWMEKIFSEEISDAEYVAHIPTLL